MALRPKRPAGVDAQKGMPTQAGDTPKQPPSVQTPIGQHEHRPCPGDRSVHLAQPAQPLPAPGMFGGGGQDDPGPQGQKAGLHAEGTTCGAAFGRGFVAELAPLRAHSMLCATQPRGQERTDGGQGAGPEQDVGTASWIRGMLRGLLTAEALRTAMRQFGHQPLTGAQVQWGFEHLTLTAASLKELGAEGLLAPLTLSCRDHEGVAPCKPIPSSRL